MLPKVLIGCVKQRWKGTNRETALSLLNVRDAVYRFTPNQGQRKTVVSGVLQSHASVYARARGHTFQVFTVSGL